MDLGDFQHILQIACLDHEISSNLGICGSYFRSHSRTPLTLSYSQVKARNLADSLAAVSTFRESIRRRSEFHFAAASDKHPGLPGSDGRRDRTLVPKPKLRTQERRQDRDCSM